MGFEKNGRLPFFRALHDFLVYPYTVLRCAWPVRGIRPGNRVRNVCFAVPSGSIGASLTVVRTACFASLLHTALFCHWQGRCSGARPDGRAVRDDFKRGRCAPRFSPQIGSYFNGISLRISDGNSNRQHIIGRKHDHICHWRSAPARR